MVGVVHAADLIADDVQRGDGLREESAGFTQQVTHAVGVDVFEVRKGSDGLEPALLEDEVDVGEWRRVVSHGRQSGAPERVIPMPKVDPLDPNRTHPDAGVAPRF